MRRIVKLERDCLIDRHGHGLRRGIAIIADVNRYRFSLHALHILGAAKIAAGALILCASRAIAPEANADRLRSPAHSAIVDIREAATRAGFRASNFAMACVSRCAAKPAPKAKRITGPKLFAAAIPTK